jgi:type III restriction enzyme
MRLALKMATGAGKTTVMVMLIAWQTTNAVWRPASKRFTRGFLVVTPGLTIRDRQRVLMPSDPDSYDQSRELIPADMQDELRRAKIVITNYHALKRRERLEFSKGGRSLLQGHGQALNTLETEGQMLQWVMPDLMGMKHLLVLNDEAHHCYRKKAGRRGCHRSEGRREEGGRKEKRRRTPLDQRPGDRRPQARYRTGHRPVGHTPFYARFGLCRRNPVSLDHERFLADRRH